MKETAGTRTRVEAALVAVGARQDEAAMAGVPGLREGRGGVDGVAPAEDVSGVEELHVGHRLWRHGGVQINTSYRHYGNSFVFFPARVRASRRRQERRSKIYPSQFSHMYISNLDVLKVRYVGFL